MMAPQQWVADHKKCIATVLMWQLITKVELEDRWAQIVSTKKSIGKDSSDIYFIIDFLFIH